MRTKFKWIFTLLLAFSMQFSFAQEKTVTGVVTDKLGPLPGANVVVKGATNGVQTDFDGKYSIKAKVGDVLEVSFTGYDTKSVTISTASTYNVVLSEGVALQEVVVVAYGTQKKEALTGSVAVIKSEEVAKITTGNVTQGLVGKVAGVQVANGNGLPGEGATIRIRGIGSVSVATPPLYVVDGVPFYGNVNSINSQDIESMTILKDAAAAALYGSRGSSGVVIITTKKGKNKKSAVTIDSRAGYTSRAVKDYDFISSPSKYYEAYYQSLKNTYMFNLGQDATTASQNAANNLITGDQGLQYNNYNTPDNQLIDPATGKFTGGTLKYDEDWSDYLFGDGFFTQTNLAVSGGNENTSHYFSLGYEKNDGYVVNSGFEKITSRLKVDTKISDKFKIGANFGYAHTTQDYLDGYDGGTTYSSPFYWIRAVAPIYPVRAYDFAGNPIINSLGQHIFDDGTGADGLSPIRPFGALQNPYATAINDYKRRVRDNLFTTAYVDYTILDGLVFTYNITGELTNGYNWSSDTSLYGDAVGAGGRVTNSSSRQFSFTNQQLLKYNKRFGNHGLDLLLGHETLDRKTDYVSASRSKFLFDSPYVDQAALNQGNGGGGFGLYALEGFLSRLAYDYDNKYFASFSARRDGSSRFHPDVRWGTFYGASVGWRISQESFLKDVSWINELKLKAGFGQQGNDNIGYDQPYLTPFTINYTTDATLPVGWTNGDYLANPDVKWETSTNMNIGLDASLFNNRFNIEVEYFKKSISDMLYNRPIPISLTGFTTRPENNGDMYNKGFEVTMSGDIVKTNNLTVSLNFNATSYKNEITRLPFNGLENNFQPNGNYILEEGGGVYDFYMREFAGVNPVNGAALFWKYIDDNDHSLGRELTENYAEADLMKIGKSAIPDVYGGFGANIAYKGFDFGIDFAYQFGGYSTDGVWLSGLGLSPGGGLHSDFSKTWTPDNTTASLPRVDTDDPKQFYSGSSLSLIKSDYLSIQNISIGYTFDSKVANKLGLNRLRFYGLADNVHLWSKRQGFDPRQSGVTGASGNNYSLLRTVSFGVNLEF
ncbi:SusC/RagA family TonB-linked outer membrane protein [Flavobacterium capsici]|uniref:TonB-dependent receptor n=1 Tax=Flavobacterium capsici TaxID=3075618 RepID=A0AA96EVR6_9FLAO|nr:MULTISPECIES: TonB-dependent receptor [unclassified Flavobacterium]WNM19071.1 TonB-dependent receptor [Flavobacterium sp. PMR2A8]WNM20460.1 TonB-dependent receptor [Flavobacterium sp. PMTSA4]